MVLRTLSVAGAIRLVLCAERAPSSDYLPQVFLEQWPHLHKHEKLLHLLTARERAGYARDFARFDSDEDGFATIDEARIPRLWCGTTLDAQSVPTESIQTLPRLGPSCCLQRLAGPPG